MPIDLLMPALSPTMEKGTLARWLVNVGDDVRPGDLLAEIETDKATMEFEAVDEGRISALMVEEGTDDIEVGTVIATLSDAVSSPTPAPALSLVAAKPDGDRVPTIISAPTAILPSNVGGPTATSQCSTADNMSPLAACLVSALGLDFKQLKGSGPAGRILKRDLGLDCNVTVRTTDGFVVADSGTRPNTGTGMRSEPLEQSSLRETPSRRLVLDGTSIPQFSLSIDCRIDALLDLRARLNLSFAGEGFKLSLNDFLIKALACALEDVPDANVHFIGNDIQRCGRVDIAIAVAAGGGVIMPVLVDVAAKRLSVVGREVRALTSQARAGELAPEQLQGGTVSLANLGKFGIERALPIINPPQGMILSIGAAQRQVRPIDDQPKIVTMLTATASFDHRAIDGAVAARLMTALRAVVEQPMIVVA